MSEQPLNPGGSISQEEANALYPTDTGGAPAKITGGRLVGQVLTLTPSAGFTISSKQWTRDGVDIAGQIGLTYTNVLADLDKTIRARVTGTYVTNGILVTEEIIITPPTLQALSLSTNTFAFGAQPGDVIGVLSGMTEGSTLSVFPADGRVVIVGNTLRVGLSAASAGVPFGITVRETLAGATGNPKGTGFSITREEDATSIPAGRVAAFNKTYYGTTPPVPQSYYDLVRAQSMDANLHPHMSGFNAVAIKNGRWSDPTTWFGGVAPANGNFVNFSSYKVKYDRYSTMLIAGIHVSGAGTFEFDTQMDTLLCVDTIMNHGTWIFGQVGDVLPQSPTGGKSRIEIVFFKQNGDPGITVNFGLNGMGPVRGLCSPKTMHLEPQARTIPANATSCVVPGLADAHWRINDEIIFSATDTAGSVSTDSTYSGPTEYVIEELDSAGNPDNRHFTQTAGFWTSQDEPRRITGIDLSTETLTWDAPLQYAHVGILRTIKVSDKTTGALVDHVVDLKPKICMMTKHIQFRTASPNNSSDLLIKPDLGPLSELQNRAHCMLMHCSDIQLDSFDCKDMGRSPVDASQVPFGPGTAVHHAYLGGPIITNSQHVQGRYAFHIHQSGAFAALVQPRLTRGSVRKSVNEVPVPGWGFVIHGSSGMIEDGTTYGCRGAGFAWELGSETGHAKSCVSMWNIGDGFDAVLEGRNEKWGGHNGHFGIGFEMPARNIQLIDCTVTSSHGFAHYQGQINSYNNRCVQDLSLRLRSPFSQGGDRADGMAPDPFEAFSDDQYGRHQPQIMPAHGNVAWGCGSFVKVIHRGPQRQDDVPMVWRDNHAVNCYSIFGFGPYTNSYIFYDAVLTGKGGGVAVRLETVAWRFSFVNCHFEGFDYEFEDAGLNTNYEGYIVDCTREGGLPARISPQSYRTFANNVNTYDWYNVMGDTEIHPTDPKQAIPRKWRVMSRTEFPTPYPLAPYGLHLGGAPMTYGNYEFVDTSPPGQAWVGGNVRNQFIISGIWRTSTGEHRYGDYQSPETFPNNMSVKEGMHTSRMTGEQAVIRNGCFRDNNGDWFVRHADRRWLLLEEKWVWLFIDRPVVANTFAAGFLEAHEILDIASAYGDPEDIWKLEALPTPNVFVPPTVAPNFTSAASFAVSEEDKLALKVKADDGHVTFSVGEGVDAAHFALSTTGLKDVYTWAGDGLKDFEDTTHGPVYQLPQKLTDAFGNTRTRIVPVTVLDVNENYLPSFSDNFVGEPGIDLGASGNWTQVSGTAGPSGQLGAYVAYGSPISRVQDDNALYTCPARTATGNARIQAKFNRPYDGSLIVLSVTDRDNLIGVHEFADRTEVVKRVAGVQTVIFNTGAARGQSNGRTLGVALVGSTITIEENGVSVGTCAFPSDVPRTGKMGFLLNGAKDALILGSFFCETLA